MNSKKKIELDVIVLVDTFELMGLNDLEEKEEIKPTVAISRGGNIRKTPELDYIEVTARVTAYAPFDNKSGMCADWNPSVTSIGHRPSSKYIAVDPKKIPYGTKVYIEGYGMTEAGDTGGALRSYDGYAIDVYFDTYEEAINWGKKYIKVRIYKVE